jgi:hypothetical protein
MQGRVKSVLVVGGAGAGGAMDERLEQAGWIVGHVPDVPAARALLHEVRPAVVLLEDGAGGDAEAVRQLERDPFMAGVRVVRLTERADPLDLLEEGVAA